MLKEKILKENYNIFELTANQVVDSLLQGKHSSKHKGFSSDFKEYRAFQNGENSRQIDWKIYSKTDKLFTKLFYNEASMKVYFILDASSSMNYPNDANSKLKRALEIIAVMCQLLYRQKDSFSIIIINDHLEVQTQLASTLAHLKDIFYKLELFYTQSKSQITTNYIPLIESLIPSLKRKSDVYFISDLFFDKTEFASFYQHLSELQSMKSKIHLLHMFDETELPSTDLQNEEIEFIDIENNTTTVSNAIKWNNYLSEWNSYKENEILLPLMEKGAKVSRININNSLLENIRTIF
ncbi:DUF58 domain-containing protein [Aquirufa sp. ROCK2-A2]